MNSVSGTTTHVFLQTAGVSVHGKCGVADAIILFDTGSDKTYISRDLIDRIGPEWVGSQNIAYVVFGGNHISNVEQRNVYSVSLQGSRGDAVSLVATEIPTICGPMFRPAVPDSVLGSFGKDIEFVDVHMGQEIKVDILVGLDSYWKLMIPEIVVMSDGLVAQLSVFGWILSGPSPVPTVAASQLSISHQPGCGASIAQPGCGAYIAQPGCDASIAQPGCCACIAQPGRGAYIAQPVVVLLVWFSLVVVLA